MKARQFAYFSAAVLAAMAVAAVAYRAPANAQNAAQPGFVVDPFWPKPLPAPMGSDGVAHTWVQGESAQ